MKIIIGADHAGYEFKEKLKLYLGGKSHEVVDVGAYVFEPTDDYSDFVKPMVDGVLKSPDEIRGIFCALSGIGEVIMANRKRGIRAVALAGNSLEFAKISREHDNTNVLCLGMRFATEDEVLRAIDLWLEHPFDPDSRHGRRLEKLEANS